MPDPIKPHILAVIFLGFSLGFFSPAAEKREFKEATPTPAIKRLKTAIESVLPPGKKDLNVGIVVASMSQKEIVYDRNGNSLLIPASVAKLFTTYAALKKMRPTATFKTSVYTNGALREGSLVGDIHLKGGGDPSLVSERLWMLVNELVRSGIKSISGNIVVDATYFDEERTPESRPKYLKDQAYNAPIGALSFNFNTTTIYVRPGEAAGTPPVVYTDPENSYIDIVNQASTGAAGSKNTLSVSRTDFVKGDIGDTILLRGSIPLDGKELRFYRNIVNPALYTGHMFKAFWEQRGLKFSGNVLEAPVPAGAKQILEFESLPLWQIVWGMNKFSSNFVADQILKKLGAEVWGTPGTRAKGLATIEDALEEIGIPRKSYDLQDGSGLTRATKITARQVLKVLSAFHDDFSIGAEAVASLGIAGEDGTLRRRLPSSDSNRILRAKTGSLDGVNSLAGYITTADGELMAFVIILNDTKLKYGWMTGWIDQIAQAIGKFSRKP